MSVSSHIKNNKKCPTPLNYVRSCQILPKTNGQTYVRNRWVTTCLTIVLCILNSLEIQNPWVPGVYLFFSENDGLWRQAPETPKTPCFGKAIGCPGCFLMSEGWVERSESCHRKRWKLPAKIPQISAKFPQIPKWRRANIFRFSGFGDGPTWQCPTVKWHEMPETPEITGKWKPLIFSKRMNLQEKLVMSNNMSKHVDVCVHEPSSNFKKLPKTEKICHE